MNLPPSLRLPFAFDAPALEAELASAPRQWINHVVRQNYDGEWSIVPLRAPSHARHPIRMIYPDPGWHDFVDTPMLAAMPAFGRVLDVFACPLRSVRLMRLAPGSYIREHCDPALSFEDGTVRMHIPVTTNPDVEFHVAGSRVVMDAGSTWYLRLTEPHTVRNNGRADRIHLVIDAVVDAWLTDIMELAARECEAASH